MSILFVTLLFSGGIPSLYIYASLFFGFTYAVNKVLLVKFYSKTTQLKRTIPDYSLKLFKYSLVAHMICGTFMLTNPNILNLADDLGENVLLE